MKNVFELSNSDEIRGFVKAKINWISETKYDGFRMNRTHSLKKSEHLRIDVNNRNILDRFAPIFDDIDINCWKGVVYFSDGDEEEKSLWGGCTTLEILTSKICKLTGIE